MTTSSAKAMLTWMKLTDEAVGVVVANDGHGLIMIDDFSPVEWEMCVGSLMGSTKA